MARTIVIVLIVIALLALLRYMPKRPVTRSNRSDGGRAPARRGEGTWNMYQGERDGLPVLLRVDTAYKVFDRKAEYPIAVVVSVPYASPSGSGFPTGPDNVDLQKLEDAVNSAIESGDKGCLVAGVTWNGSRDLYYFVKDSASANTALGNLAHCGLYRQFRFTLTNDPDWGSVEQFLNP